MTRREQLYVSDEWVAEMDNLYLRYKRGELKVPEHLKNRRLSRNLIYLIAIEQYFTEKHGFTSSPFQESD